jgi:hydrogenase-4 component H
MRYPKLREIKEAVTALIKGPYTAKFPKEPHKPFERFRGRSEYHEEDCVGCGACFEVCPAKAIDMVDTKGKRTLTVRWDFCIFCGQCQANCITGKGIMLSNDFDISTTEKREDLKQTIEKEMAVCECCGENIAAAEHILWVAKRLGSFVFSNASLMLFYLKNLGLISQDKPSLKEEQEFSRTDRIKLICPKCRREAVFKS